MKPKVIFQFVSKQIFISIIVLLFLVVSQLVWFTQLWTMDKLRLQDELTTKLSSIINYQNLAKTYSKYQSNTNNVKLKIGGQIDSKNETTPLIIGEINVNHYDSDNSFAKMVEDAFMDIALNNDKVKVSFIDSVFRSSYPHLKEISYYTLKLKRNSHAIDSVIHGNKPFLFKPFHIDIPLGSKNVYNFTANFWLKPSRQVRNMAFSIGITAVAIILVSLLIFVQMMQLKYKTNQLKYREETVSGIVHDLKSPLAYIYTMLDIFEMSEKNDAKKQSLQTSKKRVRVLSEKIESLLTSFKANQIGQIAINPAPYQFVERCNEIIEELKSVYKEKNINFGILTTPGFTLNVDKLYFEGCIRNLLDNAVKYSPDKVDIKVYTEEKNHKVYLLFRDNGCGIPLKKRNKVFKEFYRTDDSGHVKGHGVGLSFTKKIIEAHKGKIYLEKPKGKTGTTFIVELPETTVLHN